MNKLNILVLATLCTPDLFGQVKIVAIQSKTAQFQFINTITHLPVYDLRRDEVDLFVKGFARALKIAVSY